MNFNKNNYGDLSYNGKIYHLTDDVKITSALTDYPFHEASEGGEYSFVMAALAVDDEGNRYKITWLFWDTKGQEKELDEYDYSSPERCFIKELLWNTNHGIKPFFT